MSDNLDISTRDGATLAAAAGIRLSLTTPAGLQSIDALTRRRRTVLVLNLATYAALVSAAVPVVCSNGIGPLAVVLLCCFAVGTPWTVLGFWNALIGLWLLHFRKDGLAAAAPYATSAASAPLLIDTAVLMTLRNEDPVRALSRLRALKESVDATGEGARFGYFVLSDTSDPAIAAAEEKAFAAWADAAGAGARIHYRRRTHNAGFKAGNLRDFCNRWGKDYVLMLPLDADSLMAGAEVVRLVRIMQANPKIGILQSLVVGMPAGSAFARIFQFGMRHGMRCYTMGQAWWVGDCGPFWGHNALVRIAPFAADCHLPVLAGKPPLGGHVLSHDQVEAALMRAAGFEVRVLPEERGSWEENPPTMLEFARRDLRWCQGNMQYLRLVNLPGLHPMSRFQLAWAILMFIGLPAWTLMVAALPVAALSAGPAFPAALATTLYFAFFLMYLMPKIAGLIDVVLTRGGVGRYGGAVRFAASAAIELVFSFLQGAVSTLRTTIFMCGLLAGRTIAWGGQTRDARRLSWLEAARQLWPQTLFGVAVCGALLAVAPTLLLFSLPLTAGYVLAIPFAVMTADPRLGRALQRLGLCGIPEDFAEPPEIAAVRSTLG